MRTGFFVTGTDTGIGKTFVSCLLLQYFATQQKRVVGMKPVAAGSENGKWQDVELLRAASNVRVPDKAMNPYANPYAFAAPIAPHIAAKLENVTIDVSHIKSAYTELSRQADVVVVEGVGGFMVPINAHATTADLACTLNLPVILVVGMRLGCINHALLTVQAIRHRHLLLTGWVANCIDPDMLMLDENIAALQERIDAPLLGKIPFVETTDMTQLLACMDFEKLG